MRVGILERLVNGLVCDDQVLQQLSSILNGFDKLRGEEEFSDLGALAHDCSPIWKLGAILRSCDRDIVSVITKLLHGVLVDDRPDKSIVAALGVLTELVRSRSLAGDGEGLSAVERIDNSLHAINWCGRVVEEQAHTPLCEQSKRIVAFEESKIDVEERNVLSSGRISGKLLRRLLLQQLLWKLKSITGKTLSQALALDLVHGRRSPTETDEREFLPENRSVRIDPSFCLLLIRARAQEMDDDNHGDDCEDNTFLLEFAEGVALVDVVPFRVRDRAGASGSRTKASEAGLVWNGREGSWGWIWSSCEICEIWTRGAVSTGSVYVAQRLFTRISSWSWRWRWRWLGASKKAIEDCLSHAELAIEAQVNRGVNEFLLAVEWICCLGQDALGCERYWKLELVLVQSLCLGLVKTISIFFPS